MHRRTFLKTAAASTLAGPLTAESPVAPAAPRLDVGGVLPESTRAHHGRPG